MADAETMIVAGADASALNLGAAESLARLRAAMQVMQSRFAGLGAAARQAQSQIGAATAQIGAAVGSLREHTAGLARLGAGPWEEAAGRRFSSPIEHSISSALTDAVLGIRQKGGMRAVMLGIEKQIVGGMMNNLVKGLGNALLKPLFTDLAKGMGGTSNPLFSLLATALGLNTAATTANTVATTAQSAAATTSAAGGVIQAAGSAGGIFSFFKGIGSFFGFAGGGIVPSAAGGWALPSFAGGQPAVLHSREMVLPADISTGLQNMIRGGGPYGANGGGEVHVHNHFHGPADGASIGRWFSGNRGALAETVRDAWNSGALALP